jgi:hypothetical protein
MLLLLLMERMELLGPLELRTAGSGRGPGGRIDQDSP